MLIIGLFVLQSPKNWILDLNIAITPLTKIRLSGAKKTPKNCGSVKIFQT